MKQYHKNPRQISGKQFDQLSATLQDLGDLSGIVHDLNSDEIIGGNQRSKVFDINDCQIELVDQYDAPDEQGTVAHGFIIWHDKRYAYRQVRWTPQQCEKANIVANKAGGSWDFDVLANEFELDDLLDWGFEAFELGLDEDDATTPGEDTEPQIDKAEELRQKWGVETGQLWQLGEHRLICGDCTDAEVVARVGIENKMPLFTDPPYGINYDPKWLDGVGTHRQALSSRNTIVNDDGSLDLSFLSMHEKRMVWGFPYIYDQSATGWIVWDKQPGVDARGIVTPIEMAYTTMRKGFDMVRVMWGGYYRAKGEDSQPHPTQKPIGVYQPFIETWTKLNEEIADYFCGSAPTIIACENLNRRCRAVEISPGYVAVALERWHQHTGKTPVLIDD